MFKDFDWPLAQNNQPLKKRIPQAKLGRTPRVGQGLLQELEERAVEEVGHLIQAPTVTQLLDPWPPLA